MQCGKRMCKRNVTTRLYYYQSKSNQNSPKPKQVQSKLLSLSVESHNPGYFFKARNYNHFWVIAAMPCGQSEVETMKTSASQKYALTVILMPIFNWTLDYFKDLYFSKLKTALIAGTSHLCLN